MFAVIFFLARSTRPVDIGDLWFNYLPVLFSMHLLAICVRGWIIINGLRVLQFNMSGNWIFNRFPPLSATLSVPTSLRNINLKQQGQFKLLAKHTCTFRPFMANFFFTPDSTFQQYAIVYLINDILFIFVLLILLCSRVEFPISTIIINDWINANRS